MFVGRAGTVLRVHKLWIVAVFFAAGLASIAHTSQLIIVPHAVDPSEAQVDSIPPRPPTFTVKRVSRGRGPTQLADGRVYIRSSDDLGTIVFAVECDDDRSESFEIGYKLKLVGGTLADGLEIPDEVRRTLGCGGIGNFEDCLYILSWIDEPTDQQEPFEFRFVAFAVDKAGNESALSDTVYVRDAGRQ